MKIIDKPLPPSLCILTRYREMKTILHKCLEHIFFIFRFVTALPKKKELINTRKRITFMIYLKHSFLSHSRSCNWVAHKFLRRSRLVARWKPVRCFQFSTRFSPCVSIFPFLSINIVRYLYDRTTSKGRNSNEDCWPSEMSGFICNHIRCINLFWSFHEIFIC